MDKNYQQIKIEQLETVSFGDNEFKKELIEIFLEQIPEFITNLNDYFAKGDLKNLAKEAHTAKSSTLIFGMKSTGNLLKEIQIQAEQNITNQLSSHIQTVESNLKIAVKELQEIKAEL